MFSTSSLRYTSYSILTRKGTSSLSSARAARRRSCSWGRPRSRVATRQLSLRLPGSSSPSTSSTGAWRLLRRWRTKRKPRWRKLTLRTKWRRTKGVEAYQKFLIDVARDWKDERNRIFGHVILSPPICFDYGDEGFTDDWAVFEVYPSMIGKSSTLSGTPSILALRGWTLRSSTPGTDFFVSVASFGRGDVQTD